MSEIYTLCQLTNLLTPLFSKYDIYKAVLFGSYANGTATEKSDIDILVDSGLHGLRFVGFLEELQRCLNKEVHLFDVHHIQANSKIDFEIQRTGVVIYQDYACEQHLTNTPQITSTNDEKQELYLLLQEGLTDVVQGNSRPFTETIITLRNHRKNKTEVL